MDDMTAFEQQLSGGFEGLMGPPEPVDDLAIFESVTAASRSPRWGFTAFFALKFAAAGVIVALFGGFLLAGILTTQPDGEALPAAVAESPSPTTTEGLLSGMVTEEVEPGVYRVLNDGVRDLTQTNDVALGAVVAGPDGSVWLGSTGRWLRLGDEAPPTTMGGQPFEFETAPDGTLWGVTGGSLHSFDGTSWTKWRSDSAVLSGLAIAPDGTVWTTGGEAWGETTDLYRLTAEGLTAIPDWTDVYPRAAGPRHVVAAPDGAVWLIGEETPDLPGYDDGGPRVDALLRFDGSDWEVVAVPDDLRYVEGQSLDIGTDGTLWAAIGNPGEEGDGLARLDDSGWTVFTEADGVRPWGIFGFVPTDHLHAAPDGSVWVNAEGAGSSCGGVANFDGMTWTGFLSDLCVGDMDISPDGAVWVQAGTFEVNGGFEYWDPPDTYVITPEAVAAPAATQSPIASGSPTTSVRTDLLPGVELTVEEFAPGVLHVIEDGVRDLVLGGDTDIVAGHDDGIWLLSEYQLIRLGSEAALRWPEGGRPRSDVFPRFDIFEVTPDGRIWVVQTEPVRSPWGDRRDVGVLYSSDGDDWNRVQTPGHDLVAIAVAPDGTLWARWDEWVERSGGTWNVVPHVGRLGPSGWEPLAGQAEFWERLHPTASGVIYAKSCIYGMCQSSRYEDGAWRGAWIAGRDLAGTWDVAPDGTIWSLGAEGLARFAAGAWDEWAPDDLPDMSLGIALERGGAPVSTFRAAPDGSMWASLWQQGPGGDDPPAGGLWGEHWSEALRYDPACDGLVRFDGQSLDRFLPGRCVTMDIAAEGSIWVVADADEGRDLYVITPEAVAADE